MTKLSVGLLMLMMSAGLQAQDQREAMIAALRNWGAMEQVAARQIEFTVAPTCEGAIENWKVMSARFDPTLRAWVVQTSCAKSAVPFLAIVHVNDPRWLRAEKAGRKRAPILVHAGERKELTVEFAGGRIKEPVMCLRSGAAGEWIRVRSLDRKIVHRVKVSEAGELILAGRQ